jgi:hypothetical protein
MPVRLTAGGTVGGVDISVAAGTVPARHILGRVISAADGQPVQDAFVSAYPITLEPMYSLPGNKAASNGLFDISGVQPGSYTVVASNRTLTGRTVVDVGGKNVENIAIVVQPSFSINGRFIIDGRSRTGNDPNLMDLRVGGFASVPETTGLPQFSGPSFSPPPAADGSFRLDGVYAGAYRVSIIGVPADSYVESIRFGEADVLDGGLHLSGPTDASLQVVIGANAGALEGSVLDSLNQPLGNRTVVLIPDGRLANRTELYKNVSSDASGRFRMHGLTPGDYNLFAWEDIQPGAWQDPDFMRNFGGRGTPVHVNEGTNNAVQLTVIP